MQACYSNATGLSIKEVSSLIGLSASTLRNMEAFFAIPIERNIAGQRIYTENNINLFRQIKKYTGEGLQYAEIKPLLNIAVEGYSKTTPFEVVSDHMSVEEQNFSLVIKPYENCITELKTHNKELLEENKLLNRENATLAERVSNNNDILSFKDNSINELKARLQEAETRLNKKWWQVWK